MRKSPWQIQLQPRNQTYSQKKQNKRIAFTKLPMKNDNEEERVAGNEDDGSET